MLRLLLLFALLFAAIYLIKRFFANKFARKLTNKFARKTEQVEPTKKRLSEKVVKCSHCGVYVPEETVLTVSGKSYCSELHRQNDTAGKK